MFLQSTGEVSWGHKAPSLSFSGYFNPNNEIMTLFYFIIFVNSCFILSWISQGVEPFPCSQVKGGVPPDLQKSCTHMHSNLRKHSLFNICTNIDFMLLTSTINRIICMKTDISHSITLLCIWIVAIFPVYAIQSNGNGIA